MHSSSQGSHQGRWRRLPSTRRPELGIPVEVFVERAGLRAAEQHRNYLEQREWICWRENAAELVAWQLNRGLHS